MLATGLRTRDAFLDWLDAHTEGIQETLIVLSDMYPDISGPLGFLIDNAITEANEVRKLTEREQEQVYHDAQSWCDRHATYLRAMAKIAGNDYPELGSEFKELADKAADILNVYKRRMGWRDMAVEVEDALAIS